VPDDWNTIFAINAKSPHRIICEAALCSNPAGMSVVNLASIFGLRASPGSAIYSASKAALISLTRNLSLDLASRKVRVNCIAPGAVDTPMLFAAIEAIAGTESNRFYEAISRQYLMGRIISPRDVTHLCLFLLSDEAEAITGHTIPVDSGLTQLLNAPLV
jgi:NAD(P)-dependent dehydrogenase (short-subunit alcohol dehydrogenase family)